MRPLAWQARAGASLTLTEMGLEKEAQGKQYEALEMIQEVSELFQDQALKAQFLKDAGEKIIISS
jgi:hypothetical protein